MKNRKYLIILLALVALACVIALVACEDPEEPPVDDELLTYDMSGVVLNNKSVTYNGQEQELTITGSLPSGVSVSYEYYLGETKLDSTPVNAGTYKVVAKFTGDSQHNAIEDKIAYLTIAKANIEIVIGAVGVDDGSETYFEEPVAFDIDDEGTFVHMWDGITYLIDIIGCNIDIDAIEYDFYRRLNDDGTVDMTSYGDWNLTGFGDTRYVLVSISDDSYKANYNSALVVKVTVTRRTVEISSPEDFRVLTGDDLPLATRKNTRYVLTNDIDMGGNVWQTINTVIPTDAANTGFCGELDGQGYTISNFVINEESVSKDNINAQHGIAFGFFGYITDAYVHDINFSNITVDLTLSKLEQRGYAGDHLTNRLHFGVIAGRTDPARSGIGTIFENIMVENLNAYIEGFKGCFGTFIGIDYAGSTRKNLDASHVTFYGIKKDNTDSQSFSMGGLVGDLSKYNSASELSTYEDCNLTEITMTVGKGGVTSTDNRVNIGGLIGIGSPTAETITNCSISNFRIENWASSRVGVIVGYYGIHELGNNSASNDNDVDYGLFLYTSQGESIVETVVDWKSTGEQD